MLARVPAKIRRFARVFGLGGFLGLLVGYVIFYTTFPNANVPAVGEANPLFTFVTIFLGALLAGVLSDDLLAGVMQAFVAIPIGISVASLLSLSPIFGGLHVVRPDDVVFFTIRMGFPVLFASLPITIVSVVIGITVQERLGLGRY